MTLPRKSVAAAGVLVVGLAAAWLFFRRGAEDVETSAAPVSDRLVIGSPVTATPPWAKSATPGDAPAPSAQPPWTKSNGSDKPPAVPQGGLASTVDDEPQARLGMPQPVPGAVPANMSLPTDTASRFAPSPSTSRVPPADAIKAFDPQANQRPAPVAVAGLPAMTVAHDDSTPRTHRIVDGDTLGQLAQRYLGNTQRQGEIFEANRDRLKDPELLPIGVELRIPSDTPPPPLRPVAPPTNPIRSPGV